MYCVVFWGSDILKAKSDCVLSENIQDHLSPSLSFGLDLSHPPWFLLGFQTTLPLKISKYLPLGRYCTDTVGLVLVNILANMLAKYWSTRDRVFADMSDKISADIHMTCHQYLSRQVDWHIDWYINRYIDWR